MPYNADRRTNQAAVSAAATIRCPVDPGGICAYRKSDLQPEAGTQSYDQMKQMDRASETQGKFGLIEVQCLIRFLAQEVDM